MESTPLTKAGSTQQDRATHRSHWLKTLLRWHWVSSALALPALILFTFTGVTLNHAADIPANTRVTEIQAMVPGPVLQELRLLAANPPAELPSALGQWLTREQGIALGGGQAEWSETELYIAFPRPGGDAWLSLYLESGELLYEHTDRGWIAWANDLHKARNTGVWWQGFIDAFAVVCLVFCLTGLGLLWLHARERAGIWPVAGLGLLIPVLLAVLTIH